MLYSKERIVLILHIEQVIMVNKIIVYDVFKKTLRKLNSKNYNNSNICGLIFFKREALNVIHKYYCVCGYVLINKETKVREPIDIRENTIAIFEGTYNCMPRILRKALIPLNIEVIPERMLSSFFIQWQFKCDFNCFLENGPFVKFCSNILESTEAINYLINNKYNLCEPLEYPELCEFTRVAIGLSNIDVFQLDYQDTAKYLIDALLNNYHINIDPSELKVYCYQICSIVNKYWEENYA